MTSGSTGALVDTNVLVHAVDPCGPFKQQRAVDVLDRLDVTQTGIVGVQNLHEFVSVSTRRIVRPLPMEEAARVVRCFPRYWPVLPLTPEVTAEAIRAMEQHRLSWWDALIWAAV